MDLHPGAATKAPGIIAAIAKGVDFAVVDSVGDPRGEVFADFAADSTEHKLPSYWISYLLLQWWSAFFSTPSLGK